MNASPLHISLDTLIGIAPMLGHALEDRRSIRQRQDVDLVRVLQAHTSTHLRDISQQDLFCIAPFDIMLSRRNGRICFDMLEINGTGIGGLTNMSVDAIGAVLDDLRQMAEHISADDAVLLVACSGHEDDSTPQPNRVLHEKILYVEALRRGFEDSGRRAQVVTMARLAEQRRSWDDGQPAVVLGYMKEFLTHLDCSETGVLSLFGRPVCAAVNDRFCLNVTHCFDQRVDLGAFQTMNRCFSAGGDKGVAYKLWNEYWSQEPNDCIAAPIRFERVGDRATLIRSVRSWLRAGRKAVIKPQGTGHGHGIEFFLDSAEDEAAIAARIDASVRLTERLYGLRGGAFPYTVCEFTDAATIARVGHPLAGHRFELRVPVYRDGMTLKAFPSIIKIASEKYDAQRPAHLSLINNITASAQAKSRAGVEFMLPLANRQTWNLIGVSLDEMMELCSALTGFTRFLLEQVQDHPEHLGLPAHAHAF
jgi:hypothetical protein